MDDGIVEKRPTNFDFSQILIVMLNWLIPNINWFIDEFLSYHQFVYFQCNLMTKYGHESGSFAISRWDWW